MKKTIFKDVTLTVSTSYDRTYMDMLDANEIRYSTRTIPLFQTLLPPNILSYNGYEVIHRDENGKKHFAYPFITEKRDFTKCVTFYSEEKLDNLYLLDLEQALRLDKLVYENDGDDSNLFKGFNLSEEIKLEDLLDKTVALKDGSSYEFTSINGFPEGITGKKILANGDALNVILVKMNSEIPMLAINEEDAGWQLLEKEQIAEVFGTC